MQTTENQVVASGIPVRCAHLALADVATLVPNPRNPNRHPDKQVALLAKVIRHQGWRSPIVVSNRSGFVVKGHGRLEAAKLLQVEQVPIDRQDYATEADEWADLIADNRLAELSETDDAALKALLDEVEKGGVELELAGMDAEGLEDIGFGEPETDTDAEPQIDNAAELNKVWQVKPGDLWRVGEHRLLCGDSTKAEDVQRVMGGGQAGACVTDPPYGVAVVKNGMVGCDFGVAAKGKYHPVIGDETTPDIKHILGAAPQLVIWGGNYFADQLPATPSWLIWDKRNGTDIENTFADCELAWSNLGCPARIHRQLWNGMIREGEHDKRDHPTQKPVALISWCIQKTSGDVLDLYLGSGTTMVACENLSRKCRGIEISPDYCAVILQRMKDAFPELEIARL